jgi:hypothetical protein
MMPTKSLSLGSLCCYIAILNQLPDQIGLKALRSNKPILNLISDCYISAYAKGDRSLFIKADRSPEQEPTAPIESLVIPGSGKEAMALSLNFLAFFLTIVM